MGVRLVIILVNIYKIIWTSPEKPSPIGLKCLRNRRLNSDILKSVGSDLPPLPKTLILLRQIRAIEETFLEI